MGSGAFAAAARQVAERTRPRWGTPGQLAQHLEPAITRQTAALDAIDALLVDAAAGRKDRVAISMPPQEGKSQRCSRWFPLWLLTRNKDLRIAVVSYELNTARRWGRAVRNDIATYGRELGLRVRADTSAAHEWQLDGHLGGMYSVGIGGALTGRPVDVLIIDDPLKDWKAAQSQTIRDDADDWVRSVALARLAPGGIVIIISTRWHHRDLTGTLLADPETGGEWTVLNIPALADHDPAKGETDPLGREPGEWLASARGRTLEAWQRIRRQVGSRVFAALYQGRPSPADGDILQRDWWAWYDQPMWIVRDDGARILPGMDGELVASWDMAFKATDTSDFVVGQVWYRRGAVCYLLDQVRGRWTFVETMQQVVALAARWPQCGLKLVEDKANGTAVINALAQRVPGLVPVEPDGSKVARASAVAPFVEAGNVHLPDPALAPWVMDLVEEAAAFPNGAHDDQCDALSQALNRLLLNPYTAGQLVEPDEFTDDQYSISAY